jgi:hypothetical protein
MDRDEIIRQARETLERTSPENLAKPKYEQRDAGIIYTEPLSERHRRELGEQEHQFEREQRRARHVPTDWSAWEIWANQKITLALAQERKAVCTALGDEVRKAIEMIYEDVADHVKELRREIATLRSTLEASHEQLRAIVHSSDRAKVVDLPNPLRRASN